MCDEIIDAEAKSYNEEIKTIPTSFNKKSSLQTQNLYILTAVLLIALVLLITASIYCHLIKYWAKQKHSLPFYVTNNELKEITTFLMILSI